MMTSTTTGRNFIAECSRVSCPRQKDVDDEIKLWREANDGMFWLHKISESFKLDRIQQVAQGSIIHIMEHKTEAKPPVYAEEDEDFEEHEKIERFEWEILRKVDTASTLVAERKLMHRSFIEFCK
ncbi:2506_t:CDS:2 [Paraglomus occultum]|uniref:2506_t:CDS:1 n=1 Tax=Paraglomus occultum TaxID=144539 RepID=A0A9N8ZBN2_9GLOM|nr:2506_t:CDS:2 [Paraglomus occultum]